MPIPASRFLSSFQQIKAFLQQHDELPDDLLQAWDRLQASFKRAYTPADFKVALGENQRIPDDLEEQVTSALMLMHRERARLGREADPEPEGDD